MFQALRRAPIVGSRVDSSAQALDLDPTIEAVRARSASIAARLASVLLRIWLRTP